MAGTLKIQVRRVSDERLPEDGAGALVDRLWPRGLTKAKADPDRWCNSWRPRQRCAVGGETHPAGPRRAGCHLGQGLTCCTRPRIEFTLGRARQLRP